MNNTGTGEDKVKQIGNAWTGKTAEALCEAVLTERFGIAEDKLEEMTA